MNSFKSRKSRKDFSSNMALLVEVQRFYTIFTFWVWIAKHGFTHLAPAVLNDSRLQQWVLSTKQCVLDNLFWTMCSSVPLSWECSVSSCRQTGNGSRSPTLSLVGGYYQELMNQYEQLYGPVWATMSQYELLWTSTDCFRLVLLTYFGPSRVCAMCVHFGVGVTSLPGSSQPSICCSPY